MTDFQPGDVVQVRNARNNIGVYEIASKHNGYYKVYVLDLQNLPLVGSERFPNMQLRPKDFLKRAKKDHAMWKGVVLKRERMTVKAKHNILYKLPVSPTQVEF